MSIKMEWKGLERFAERTDQAAEDVHDSVYDAALDWCDIVEKHMKSDAPWTDRTGRAREGLYARADDDDDGVTIAVGSDVDYQIWLEVRYGGRWAIIGPTVDRYDQELIEMIQASAADVGL